MIAIILSSLLFVKYIFFDKSETFPIPPPSVPANGHPHAKTSPPQGKPASPAEPPAAVCPFALPQADETSFKSLSADHLPSAVSGKSHLSRSMEKLVSEGMVLDTTDRRQPSALPAPDTADSGSGGMSRSRSSSKLLETSSNPRADLSLDPTAAQCVSVSTQTEDLEQSVGGGVMFTVGMDRKISTPDSESSGIASLTSELTSRRESPAPVLPPVPRQLEECVSILKSDVS